MAPVDITSARAALAALRELELERAEEQQARRRDALERVRGAVVRIGGIGSPVGMLDRAAEELGASAAFDRVLISRLSDDTLTPVALWESGAGTADAGTLTGLETRLAYPLIEAEVVQRRRTQIVDVAAVAGRSPAALRERFGWSSYVVATMTLHDKAIGLVHVDATASGRRLDELDRDVAALYAVALARCFELAVLRHTLGHHRDEQWTAVQWMSERLERAETPGSGGAEAFRELRADPLTAREREVVELLCRGMTNGAIARSLTISEGTAKYHVGNVLRKLGATSRADAVARYLRSDG